MDMYFDSFAIGQQIVLGNNGVDQGVHGTRPSVLCVYLYKYLPTESLLALWLTCVLISTLLPIRFYVRNLLYSFSTMSVIIEAIL